MRTTTRSPLRASPVFSLGMTRGGRSIPEGRGSAMRMAAPLARKRMVPVIRSASVARQ